MIAKCLCQHCEGGLEFESDDLTPENDKINCPHCGCETQLVYEGEFKDEMLARAMIDDDYRSRILRDKSISTEKRREIFKATAGRKLADMQSQCKELERNMNNIYMSKITSNGDTLEVRGENIVICRTGLANMLAAGMNGERSISIPTLTGIQLKLGGMLSPGYILFSYAGSKPFMGGIFEATQDPDAFIFGREFNGRVSKFKTGVEGMMQELRQSGYKTNHTISIADELKKLLDLKSIGAISDFEFESAKQKLLS